MHLQLRATRSWRTSHQSRATQGLHATSYEALVHCCRGRGAAAEQTERQRGTGTGAVAIVAIVAISGTAIRKRQ